jgi:hypothetical protein
MIFVVKATVYSGDLQIAYGFEMPDTLPDWWQGAAIGAGGSASTLGK